MFGAMFGIVCAGLTAVFAFYCLINGNPFYLGPDVREACNQLNSGYEPQLKISIESSFPSVQTPHSIYGWGDIRSASVREVRLYKKASNNFRAKELKESYVNKLLAEAIAEDD